MTSPSGTIVSACIIAVYSLILAVSIAVGATLISEGVGSTRPVLLTVGIVLVCLFVVLGCLGVVLMRKYELDMAERDLPPRIVVQIDPPV